MRIRNLKLNYISRWFKEYLNSAVQLCYKYKKKKKARSMAITENRKICNKL